jgi:hypothetical protein
VQERTSLRQAGFEFRLTVWHEGGEAGWHACVVAADDSRREFASPFELARYLARLFAGARDADGKGLR